MTRRIPLTCASLRRFKNSKCVPQVELLNVWALECHGDAWMRAIQQYFYSFPFEVMGLSNASTNIWGSEDDLKCSPVEETGVGHVLTQRRVSSLFPRMIYSQENY